MRSQIETFVLEQIYSKDFEWIPKRKTSSLPNNFSPPEQRFDDMLEERAEDLHEFISECNRKLRKQKVRRTATSKIE